MSGDEDNSYMPEIEPSYTEAETQEALKFIKDNDLPMSDLLYALKYVRISNRATALDDQFKEIRKRLKALREESIIFVTPPEQDES